MAKEVPQIFVDVNKAGTHSVEILPGLIPGATPYHHTIEAGDAATLEAGNFYHILVLIAGEAEFITAGKGYPFSERVAFVPDPAEQVVIAGKTNSQVLELRWEIAQGDDELAAEYQTAFPFIQVYRTSKQYRDKNKSDKTISRVMVEQRNIPRFCMGSVESYGPDTIKPHDHPMLDQYFFSFPENDMDVLIDGVPIPMKGNELLYIPLGAVHGVDVEDGKHLHYMWIDFSPDNEKALARLDSSHIATGTYRSFDEEAK